MFSLDHIALSVVNIEKSISFYKIFGFNKFNEWSSDDGSLRMVMLKNGDEVYIELVHCTNSKQLPDASKNLDSDMFQVGVKHIALRVESVVETIDFLEHNGIFNYSNVLMGKLGRKYFYINDPDGIVLEFIDAK